MSSIASIPNLPEITANAAHTLTIVACSLLDRQIHTLTKRFESKDGFTEEPHRIRAVHRDDNPHPHCKRFG
jgi:four helix bundle suffix protein